MSATSETLTGEPRSLVGSFFVSWDRFWFGKMDPTSLAFIRVACGLLTLYLHITYCWGLLGYVGPEGWLDAPTAEYILREIPIWGTGFGWDDNPTIVTQGNYYWSIYFHVTDTNWIIAIHSFFLLNMLLFTLGLGTRYTGAITWVGAMSYVQRANTTVFGVDTMMLILLFYLMIGPSGATLSLDRLIQKWWARRKGLPIPPVEPSYSANFAIRLMQVHFCLVYLASGTSKLLGSTWWSGTAMNLVVLNAAFAPMEYSPYLQLMKTLAARRWLWETVMSFNILFTIILEIGFPFLVWNPRLRWLMVTGSICLHTGIGLIMGLTTFSLMMMIFVSSFVPPEVIARAVSSISEMFGRLASARPATRRTGELVMSR